MAWQTPKTNWDPTDGVADDDFNRIEGNIQHLEDVKLDEDKILPETLLLLGGQYNLPVADNLNNETTPRTVRIDSTTANRPSEVPWGFCRIEGRGNTAVYQHAFRTDSTGIVYMLRRYTGTGWTAWVKMMTSSGGSFSGDIATDGHMSAYTWGQFSSGSNGMVLLGQNCYIDRNDGNKFKYKNSHGSMGAQGFVFPLGAGGVMPWYFKNPGACVAGQSFTPTYYNFISEKGGTVTGDISMIDSRLRFNDGTNGVYFDFRIKDKVMELYPSGSGYGDYKIRLGRESQVPVEIHTLNVGNTINLNGLQLRNSGGNIQVNNGSGWKPLGVENRLGRLRTLSNQGATFTYTIGTSFSTTTHAATLFEVTNKSGRIERLTLSPASHSWSGIGGVTVDGYVYRYYLSIDGIEEELWRVVDGNPISGYPSTSLGIGAFLQPARGGSGTTYMDDSGEPIYFNNSLKLRVEFAIRIKKLAPASTYATSLGIGNLAYRLRIGT